MFALGVGQSNLPGVNATPEEKAFLIANQIDWRDKMSIKPELLVSPEELIKPMEDIWEE